MISAQPNTNYGYWLHHNGASHLAIDTLQQSISHHKETSSYHEVAVAYKTLAEVYFDAGYPIQFNHCADSFFHYINLAHPNQPIYFVDYASLKVRHFASEHNYPPALNMLDSAYAILHQHKAKAYLIDSTFLHLNWLNVLRNNKDLLNVGSKSHYYYTDSAYQKIHPDKISNSDPFQFATYQKFLGNYNQDMVNLHIEIPPETFEKFKTRTLKHYQTGYDAIIDSLGYANLQATWLKMLLAHQQFKLNKINEAEKLMAQCIDELAIEVNGKLYFRHLLLPQYLIKWYANVALKSNNFDSNYFIDLIKSAWQVRRLYSNSYLKESENILKEPYEYNLNPTLINIALADTQNIDINIIWDYISVQRGFEIYAEAVKNSMGSQKFKSCNNHLDSLQTALINQLDRLFLLRKNKWYSTTTDSSEIKFKIEALNKQVEDYLNIQPSYYKRFCEFKSPIDYNAFTANLQQNEAFIIFSNEQLFQTANNVFVIKKDSFKHYVLPASTAYNSISDSLKPLFNEQGTLKIQKLNTNKVFIQGYKRLFAPLKSFLKDIDKLTVFGFYGEGFPFELLTEKNEESTSIYSHEHRLQNKIRFLYSRNISADILNREYLNHGLLNKVVFSDVGNNYKNQNIPFMYKTCRLFAEYFNINLDFAFEVPHHAGFDKVLLVSHGSQKDFEMNLDKGLNSNILHFNNQRLDPLALDNLDFKANFIALVSCQAADGIQTKTGKYDHIWALFKNGTKTILASPYYLDDKVSAYILQQFYLYLKDGYWASEALQKAKLDFLALDKDPILNHPKYWAGLMLYGNDYKMPKTTQKWGIKFLLIAGLILFLIACFKIILRIRK